MLNCIYCGEMKNILRWEDNKSPVCIDCGQCCWKQCLPHQLDNSNKKYFHDKALLFMDSMFSEWYEFKERKGVRMSVTEVMRSISREDKREEQRLMHSGYLSMLTSSILDTMAEMMLYRKGYWQNGAWRSFQ